MGPVVTAPDGAGTGVGSGAAGGTGSEADGGSAGVDELAADVRERLAGVRGRIRRACEEAGRDPDQVRLIGVTKTHPPEMAQAAVEVGVEELGENRVDELLAKQERVGGARWHFVGQLQSRKARDVVGGVELIHSVDRASLVDEITKRAEQPQGVLLQVNVGEDPRKGGCPPDELEELLAYADAKRNVEVRGLMTMPPQPDEADDPGEAARPHFARLRDLRDRARASWPGVAELSMGMSADLEAAVAEGATMVRVGSALFGPRGPRPWQPISALR